MRLTGVMLEGPQLIEFCEMRKRSYLAPPARSVAPPVEMVPSGSSTDRPGDLDMAHDPSSSTINPSSSTSDPWTVDNQDSIDDGAEKLSDRGKSPLKTSQSVLILSQVRYLG